MPNLCQVFFIKVRIKRIKKTKAPAMKKRPHLRAIVQGVLTMKNKKPSHIRALDSRDSPSPYGILYYKQKILKKLQGNLINIARISDLTDFIGELASTKKIGPAIHNTNQIFSTNKYLIQQQL